jgi:archaellum biogenesis protein FlaJ (TadC family)
MEEMRSRRRSNKRMSARPLPVTVAIVLLALLSLANLLSPVMPSEGVPAFVTYLGVVLGVLGLIGAGGLWMLKRWALWLTIVVSVLNILSAAPGLAFAPTPTLRALATVGVVGFALVILLAVLPNSRRAYT